MRFSSLVLLLRLGWWGLKSIESILIQFMSFFEKGGHSLFSKRSFPIPYGVIKKLNGVR